MDTAGPALWLIILTIGVIALAAALAYGRIRSNQQTPAERARTEAAARAEQLAEDRDDS